MKKWTYNVSVLTQQEIAEAIKELEWQTFRLSMKGLPTEDKLLKLEQWMLNSIIKNPPNLHYRFVQIDNYINALKRGGQLNDQLEVVR